VKLRLAVSGYLTKAYTLTLLVSGMISPIVSLDIYINKVVHGPFALMTLRLIIDALRAKRLGYGLCLGCRTEM
jgi:hypothetical protein